MAKRPSHHPPLACEYTPPFTDYPVYIKGETGIIGFGKKDFYITAIPRKLAVDTIIKHHYSGRVVNNSYVHIGVYIHGYFMGVLQFGYLMQPRMAHTIVEGTEVTEYLELNRMWLSDKAQRNSESQAISYCIKYIKAVCPSVAWVQSFADERCGGWGIVYQAANFIYCGSHFTTFYELDGQTYHSMLLGFHKNNKSRVLYLRENLHRAKKKKLRQFRYVYFIKKSWKKRLLKIEQPYPKHYLL